MMQLRSFLLPPCAFILILHISSVLCSIRVKKIDEPSAFYLDPVGIESGPWSEWGTRSQCTKLCDGGISYETRTCRNKHGVGHVDCVGPRKRYFTCHTEPCQENTSDFRTEQCSKFDDTPYQGQKYRWIPYKKSSNKCELLCRPENGSFYVSFAPQVIDGTACNDDNTAVCVRGKCVSIGCDKRLGSLLQEDKCRVCGGDGSSCKFVEGLYDDSDVPESSYAEFLIIPSGSTNIQIRERRPSENYIALRNVSGEYVLNGDFKVESGKRTLRIAGTLFTYYRESAMHPPAELLMARGPTTEPVAIAMLHQEVNPGVLYEFYAPNSAKDVGPLSFTWLARSYGPCSSGCGGGRQARPVVCVRTSDYEPVDDEQCDALVKPQASRQCNVDPCPAFWKVGEWASCSASCGGGTQYRTIVCGQLVGDYTVVVPDAQCKSSAQHKPEVARNCNQFKCPDWMVGEWSPCSAICGPGFQIRTVECRSRNPKDKTEYLSDAACNVLKKPGKTQDCLLAPCEGLEWAVSDWTGCNSCGQSQRTRRAVCTSENGTVYPSSMCAAAKKPGLSDACANAPPCAAMWFSTEWSKCSASCGEGMQTREVFCGTIDNRNSSQVVRVSSGLCEADKKLEEKRSCKENFTCDGQWFSGPWMPCTQKCGGGSKRRYIICLKNDSVVDSASCDKEEKPSDSEDCNTEPCDKEGFLGAKADAAASGTQKDGGVPCAETEFGCCPDNATVADGPYGAGCNATDAESGASKPRNRRLKSVPMFPMDNNGTLDLNGTEANTTDTTDSLDLDENDMVTTEPTPSDNATLGEDLAIAPTHRKPMRSQPQLRNTTDSANATDCDSSPFGCCSDNSTAASGPNKEGCDDDIEGSAAECEGSEHGCCPDGKTAAPADKAQCPKKTDRMLPSGAGVPVPQGECAGTEFGCCEDGQTQALGPQRDGCPEADCANSYHGCCPDGVTFASGPNYEECPHTKPPKQNCEMYSDQGTCRNYSVKWHYDFEYGDCNRFWYGGCDGNDNRFDSEGDCQGECIHPVGTAVCSLPKVHGPCDQNLRMWYYDKYVRECLPFHYGGCLGNDNRFESREDCNERCVETAIPDVCQQPVRQGKGPGQIVRWYFDKATGRCNQYFYSGSGGNGNRFTSEDQCLKKCSAGGEPGGGEPGGEAPRPADICTLERAEGDCKEYYPKFYFDRYTQRCEPFTYTGCNGNENRFETNEECQQVCQRYLPPPEYATEAPTVSPAVAHCFLPSDRGTCERSLPRWHYDSTDGVCKRFLFSGCGGNTNNFETQLHCLNDCGMAQDKCDLPKVVGPCRGLLNVYYFDKYERRCLPFQYGGCQGNANRFQSEEECEQSCSHVIAPPTAPPVDENTHTIPPEYPQTYPTAPGQNPYLAICSMPVDAGACDERQARYYYDISQGKCLSFTYTGCGGNQNHFHTTEQCEGFCAQFGVGCPARTCDIQCPYGYENDPSSCPTCRCVEPCRDIQCPAYATCTVQSLPNGEFVGTCTSRLEKAGTCPRLEDIPPGSCDRACGSDNECHGQQKCCNNGCGTACMTPVELVGEPPVVVDPPREPYDPSEPHPPPVYPEEPVTPEPQPAPGGQPYPAFISAGPHEVRAEPGQPIVLPCHARGIPEPQVTWQHNNHTVRLDEHHLQQRGNDLHIEDVRVEDSGDYVCFANNGLGPSAEHHIRLNVEAVVRIDGGDTVVSSRLGDRAILKCSAHGVPQPRISWSKGGEPIGQDQGKLRQTGDDSLVIENVQYDDQSVYICTADNGVHAPAIKNVVFRVHEEIKAQIVAQAANFASGSTVRLDCRASGYPQPRVRWYLNAQEIVSDGDRSQVFTNGTLLIKKARSSDAGVYQCQASNEQSTSSDSLRIFITGAPLTHECTDNEYYANCKLIVVAELCNNEYYAKFCCKSCTESGQIRAGPHRRRRKRSLRPVHFL